ARYRAASYCPTPDRTGNDYSTSAHARSKPHGSDASERCNRSSGSGQTWSRFWGGGDGDAMNGFAIASCRSGDGCDAGCGAGATSSNSENRRNGGHVPSSRLKVGPKPKGKPAERPPAETPGRPAAPPPAVRTSIDERR